MANDPVSMNNLLFLHAQTALDALIEMLEREVDEFTSFTHTIIEIARPLLPQPNGADRMATVTASLSTALRTSRDTRFKTLLEVSSLVVCGKGNA